MTLALRVRGSLTDALGDNVLRAISPDALLAFLGGRRWFGAKATARSARLLDVVAVPSDPRFAIARVEIELGDGQRLRYQLPLTVRANGGGADALAHIVSDSEVGDLIDAAADPAFRAWLGATFATGARFGSDTLAWVVEPVGDGVALNDVKSRLLSGEQSNSSIVYDDRAILKLFRRLEAGVHPDVEITRFLTERTDFRNTPKLLGIVAFTEPGARTMAGMLTEIVPGAADGWAYTLDRAQEYFAAKADEPKNSYVADARDLGRATRALHDALASDATDPEFAPMAALDEDVQQWGESAREVIERALALLGERAGALEPQWSAAARALVARQEEIETRVDDIVDAVGEDAGMLIRHHGDFHLGQLLRAHKGQWMIIDFEGEPSRPLDQRRQRNSPLRDVAGMLRSFAYAAATVGAEIKKNTVDPRVELRGARWERDARVAFLDGYGIGAATDAREKNDKADAAEQGPGILPREPRDVGDILALFEIEKTFYELAYELNNRPAWAWIPLRGIARML